MIALGEFGRQRSLPETLVDTGAELTWAPRAVLEALNIVPQKRLGFRTADGRAIYREIGYAIVLGARSLEGLNLRADSRSKQLIDAGWLDRDPRGTRHSRSQVSGLRELPRIELPGAETRDWRLESG
jgi:hypothetical protein